MARNDDVESKAAAAHIPMNTISISNAIKGPLQEQPLEVPRETHQLGSIFIEEQVQISWDDPIGL